MSDFPQFSRTYAVRNPGEGWRRRWRAVRSLSISAWESNYGITRRAAQRNLRRHRRHPIRSHR